VNLKVFLKSLFVVVALGFMSYYFIENWSTLKQYNWHFNIRMLMLSSILLWLAFFTSIILIHRAFIKIGKAKINFIQLFRIFNISNLGRYVPGKIWNILGLYYLAGEYNINKKQTTLAILVNEVAYKGSALLIGIFYFIFSSSFKQYFPFMIFSLIFLLIIIHPKVIDKVLNFILKLFKKPPINVHFNYITILIFFILYIGVWMIYSLAFYVFVNSITQLESVSIIHFFTILPLCWVVGYIMIFAPGGIGVREGMLIVILSEFLPSEVALVIALSQRIWFTLIEGINILISLLISSKAKPISNAN